MTGTNIAILLGLLKRHEGVKLKMYKCSAGKNTIGIGTNLDAGISESQAEALAMCQIQSNYIQLEKMDWYKELSPARQIAINDMAYNIGVVGVCKFTKMILAMQKKDFKQAAAEILDSQYAKQVGQRAVTISKIIETDKLNGL